MANKTIPNLPDYGSQDTDKIKKDLLEITKNDGTYASPSYPTGASRKITVEEFKTALAIDSSFIKDLVVKFNADTVLEIGKINWVLLNNNHTMSIATPDASNLGKICLVTNRVLPHHSGPVGPYTITITGTTATPLEITGENSIVGLVCVTDGIAYGWEVFSRYNVGDFNALVSDSITDGVTTVAPSQNAVFDALALKEPVITKNSLSTPLVWTSANGVASFQPIPVLGDLTYYFTNTASDVATYYKQTTTPQVALTSLPFASVTDGQLLATFISEPSNPNRLSIPDGQYLNHLHLGKTGGTKDLQVRAEIWETTSAGVDIVKLADLGPSSILVGSASTEYVIGYNTVEKTLSDVTSRIATKLYAIVGVSGSAPSISIFQGDGSDSRSNLPAPVVDATNYVPYVGALSDVTLGSKTLTAQDVSISSATASTVPYFDVNKKLVSSTVTPTQLSYLDATSSIQTQLNDKSTAYAIPNYYRVDLNLGDDLTGVAGREDKPYKLIQTVWDLISASSTAQITIEIVGDYTFTTHALLTSVSKDNITFLFKGKITYAVTATTTSRPLFTFSGTNNNLTFIVPNYTQTTQGGFINTLRSTGHRYIIDNMQILLGVSTSSVNNIGFYSQTSSESYFQCNNLTISLTGDGSAIRAYQFPMYINNCNFRINSLKITGTASVATTLVNIFYGVIKSLYIENLTTDNSYTNLTNFGITSSVSCDNIFINNISVASDGATVKTDAFALFKISSCKNLTIMSGSILNYAPITSATTQIENLNLGNLTINGNFFYDPYGKILNLLGNITKTVATQGTWMPLLNGATINGNGFKIYHSDPTYSATGNIILLYGASSAKAYLINNLTIYNTNMVTNNANPAFVPIMYYLALGITARFRSLLISSNNDAHTEANTSFIRPYNANTTYTCRIEGNVATNYVKNITNLTNDADIDLINGYTL